MMTSDHNKDKKALLSNFFSLSVLQGVNMLLPLITLPYLVRVLGVEGFGLVNFALSIIMFFAIFVSFGFELSATREISTNKNDPSKVSEIFSSVMIIKIIMTILSFIVLLILINTVNVLTIHSELYYATFGIVIGNAMFPIWFFQGMEKMKYIAYINISSTSFFTILIFVFVESSADILYVPILNSFGFIVGGLVSLFIVYKQFNINFYFPRKEILVHYLKDSNHYFLSRVANNGSRYYSIALIGVFFGNTIVGFYTMAEKLYYAFMGLAGVISQTIYPYMSRTKNKLFIRKIIAVSIFTSAILLIPIMIFSEELIRAVFGLQEEVLTQIFTIMFSGSIFGVVSILIGYPVLAAFGYKKYANNSLIYAAIVFAFYITIATYIFGDILITSSAVVVYTLCVLIFRMRYICKTKIFLKEEGD
jgi:polysaccharide transporter, PST family